MTSSNPNLVGSVDVGVNLKDGALAFSYMGESFRTPGGGVMSGMVLGTGDIDLSNTPHGDVEITVSIEDAAFNAGYRFPGDPWQAVALAAVASDTAPPPAPVFDPSRWPANFLPPTVSADRRSVSWIDLEADQTIYEYAVAVDGPKGRVVLDPRIKPGGSTTR